jgi:hypothetical protein
MKIRNEEQLQQEIVTKLENYGWEVKQYVKREDCKNWTHPYTCDLLIRHSAYPIIGWIGVEIKDHHKVADAFQQIISRYQNHYFENISQPINAWAIIVNTDADTSYKYNFGRIMEQKIYLQKFGIAINYWKDKNEDITFNLSYSAKCSIYFNTTNNRTSENALHFYIIDKVKWMQKLNINNIGFTETKFKSFKEAMINDSKGLFDYI